MTQRDAERTDETSPLVGAHRRARHRAAPDHTAPRIRDRRRRARSPRTFAVAAVLGVIAGVGVTSSAAAYWTGTGTATGAASTGSVAAVVLDSASTVGTLRPGGASDVTVVARNPNTTEVRIRALELDTAAGTNGYDVAAGCGTSALAFVGATAPNNGWRVPAAANGVDGTTTIVLPGALYLTQDAANACQSQPVSVRLREVATSPSTAERIATATGARWHLPLGASGATSTIGARTGTASGGPVSADGRVGTATRFDGVDDQIVVADLPTGDFTVAFWFRASSAPTGGGVDQSWWRGAGLIDADLGGVQPDWGISLMADGRVEAGVGSAGNGAGETGVRSPSGLVDGAWHHVALTRSQNDGAVVLYVDGQVVSSATSSYRAAMTATSATLGTVQTPNGRRFAGDLDEVSVVGSVLGSSQIATLYRVGGMAR